MEVHSENIEDIREQFYNYCWDCDDLLTLKNDIDTYGLENVLISKVYVTKKEILNGFQNHDMEELAEILLSKENIDRVDFHNKLNDIYKHVNTLFQLIFNYWHNNNIYTELCSFYVYQNTFESKLKTYENKVIDVELIKFLKIEYQDILNGYQPFDKRTFFDLSNREILNDSKRRKLEFISDKMNDLGYQLILNDIELLKNDYYNNTFVDVIKQNSRKSEVIQLPKKTNKSLLFEGKELNLSERFRIANKVLDIDKKIRTLNIPELEKYQLLAYILGCDKDNARNLMNGQYKSKDRDLSNYFNDLDLKE